MSDFHNNFQQTRRMCIGIIDYLNNHRKLHKMPVKETVNCRRSSRILHREIKRNFLEGDDGFVKQNLKSERTTKQECEGFGAVKEDDDNLNLKVNNKESLLRSMPITAKQNISEHSADMKVTNHHEAALQLMSITDKQPESEHSGDIKVANHETVLQSMRIADNQNISEHSGDIKVTDHHETVLGPVCITNKQPVSDHFDAIKVTNHDAVQQPDKQPATEHSSIMKVNEHQTALQPLPISDKHPVSKHSLDIKVIDQEIKRPLSIIDQQHSSVHSGDFISEDTDTASESDLVTAVPSVIDNADSEKSSLITSDIDESPPGNFAPDVGTVKPKDLESKGHIINDHDYWSSTASLIQKKSTTETDSPLNGECPSFKTLLISTFLADQLSPSDLRKSSKLPAADGTRINKNTHPCQRLTDLKSKHDASALNKPKINMPSATLRIQDIIQMINSVCKAGQVKSGNDKLISTSKEKVSTGHDPYSKVGGITANPGKQLPMTGTSTEKIMEHLNSNGKPSSFQSSLPNEKQSNVQTPRVDDCLRDHQYLGAGNDMRDILYSTLLPSRLAVPKNHPETHAATPVSSKSAVVEDGDTALGLLSTLLPNPVTIQNFMEKTMDITDFQPLSPSLITEDLSDSDDQASTKDTNNQASNGIKSEDDGNSNNNNNSDSSTSCNEDGKSLDMNQNVNTKIHTRAEPETGGGSLKSEPVVPSENHHKAESSSDKISSKPHNFIKPCSSCFRRTTTKRSPRCTSHPKTTAPQTVEAQLDQALPDLLGSWRNYLELSNKQMWDFEVEKAASVGYNEGTLNMIKDPNLHVWELIEGLGPLPNGK